MSVLENALKKVLTLSEQLSHRLQLQRAALRGTLPLPSDADASLEDLRDALEEAQQEVILELEALAERQGCTPLEVLTLPLLVPLRPLRRKVATARERVEAEARMTRYVIEHYRSVVLHTLGNVPMTSEAGYGASRPRYSGVMVHQVC